MHSHYYITQYGAWWKLTHAQWLVCLRQGAAGQGYDLPSAAMLKGQRRPAGARFGNTFKPLDWYPEDFAYELECQA
jgi:hypothetical protein